MINDLHGRSGEAVATPLFDAVCDPNTLTMAWARVRGNRGAAGGDGESVAGFGRAFGVRIERLAAELRSGSYRPGPVRRVQVKKKSGGERTLAIPCVVDRVAQTAAALVLTPVLEPEMEDASHAYRAGRGVATAVARVSALQREGYGYVVDGDIRAYFDSVPHAPLLARLARSVADARLLDLVALWLDSFDDDGIGIPQGSPLSPLLANLYLDEVDEAIETAGVRLVRYADDFVLLCRSEVKATGALARIAALLAERGLELNLEKSRVVSFQEGVRFLGHLFVRSLVFKQAEEAAQSEAEAAAALEQVSPPPGLPAVAPSRPLAPPAGGPAVDESGAAAADLRAAFGAAEAGRLAPIIAPLYVMEKGRRVALRNEAFVVLDGGAELLALPPGQVDRIEIGPAVDISTEAVRQAMAWNVPVAMLNGWGETVGSIEPRLTRRAGLHLAQAACVLDPERRLALARVLAAGRLRSQQKKLKKLNLTARNATADAIAAKLLKDADRCTVAKTVAEAMGFEGAATAQYWRGLAGLLRHGWRLERRERRPPGDAVNAVISWLSAMVTRDVHALVLRRGLHPGFGILHGSADRHEGAVYDLVEEFRAPLAEGVAVALFNRRHLRAEHFFEQDGVRLLGDGRSVVIRAYEAMVDQKRKSPRRGVWTSWRGLMEEQVDAYARHMLGQETYRPCEPDY